MKMPIRWCLLGVLGVAVSTPGMARNTVAYFSINPGFQWYDTTELIVDKGADTAATDLFPLAGFMPDLRFGVNASGYGGLEAFIAAHGWDLESKERGGGGVVGGLIRLTPLEAAQYLWQPMENRFVDIGLSFGAGYTLVGEDFAYQGWFLQYGFDINIFVLPFLAVGFELPIRQMMYAPFRYTHFGEMRGLCTRGGKAYDAMNREVVRTAPREITHASTGENIGQVELDASGRVTGNYILGEIGSGEREDYCSGPAPAAWQYSPMLKLTFLVDFGV